MMPLGTEIGLWVEAYLFTKWHLDPCNCLGATLLRVGIRLRRIKIVRYWPNGWMHQDATW